MENWKSKLSRQNPEYCKIARQRIKLIENKPTLFAAEEFEN
jgi:hypothetical protein